MKGVRIEDNSFDEPIKEVSRQSHETGRTTENDEAPLERDVLEEVARLIAARGLCAPAIFVLECIRPISFLTGEFLVFLKPFIWAFLDSQKYDVLAEALHDRRSVSWLVRRLEELEAEQTAARRGAKADNQKKSEDSESVNEDERSQA
jgi:hypothetical protein